MSERRQIVTGGLDVFTDTPKRFVLSFLKRRIGSCWSWIEKEGNIRKNRQKEKRRFIKV
jgi:hypothetical protein